MPPSTEVGLAAGAQGERHPRQAHPGRDRTRAYRNIRVEPTDEARAQAYSIDYDTYDYDFGQSTGQSVALDDFDFGSYRN
jgi:hypothetical protein